MSVSALALVLCVRHGRRRSLVAVGARRRSPPADRSRVRHGRPIDAPIVDPFRPPAREVGGRQPGHRLRDHAGHAGRRRRRTVASSSPGQVGGTLHVIVRHADGVRTSYSFLASIAVVEGQTRRERHDVGTAGRLAPLRRAIRRHLLRPRARAPRRRVQRAPRARRRRRPRHNDGSARCYATRSSTSWLSGERRGGVHDARWCRWLRSTADPAAIVTARGALLRGDVGDRRTSPAFGAATWRWYRSRSSVHRAGDAGTASLQQPVGDHLVVLVAGFGSASSPGAGVDLVDLTAARHRGATDVMRFSLQRRDGCPTPTGAPFAALDDDHLRPRPTARPRSTRPRAVCATRSTRSPPRTPARPIDVIAHSQGGVVALRGLSSSRRPAAPGQPAPTSSPSPHPHRGDDRRDRRRSALTRPAARGRARRSRSAGSTCSTDDAHDSGAAADLSLASPFMDDYRSRACPTASSRCRSAADGTWSSPLATRASTAPPT